MTDISARKLVATVGTRQFPVTSWQQVSDAYTAAIDATNVGASQAPQCIIKARNGRIVAHCAYNGKVFAGRPEDWRPGMPPICWPGQKEGTP